MQQSIAKAHNSGNLRSETDRYTHDTETLAAVGMGASRLASLLLRVRNAEQPRWAREAALLLASPVMKTFRLSRDVAERIAAAAMTEWSQPHCRSCGGAGSTHRDDGVVIVCWKCDGVGVWRYTDRDREEMVREKFRGRVASAYDAVMSSITTHVGDGLSAAKCLTAEKIVYNPRKSHKDTGLKSGY